jgi:ATP-dependent Lhr-like helicase
MRGGGVDVFVHHSSVSLEERRDAEQRFHHGANVAIVCTSTLELGIDVGDLDLVFQANAPSTVSSFMQRMGRTGRRPGQAANTTFYCETPDEVLQATAIVELAREGWVESVADQARCWPVLVHQLLAMTLQFGAVSAERCWDQLARVPDFSAITRPEFDEVIEHMKAHDYLFESGGLLSMGTKTERAFGRKNFSELYAVFSSPVLYRVQTAAGKDLGSLEQNFVDRLVDEMSSFLLGGRAWTVEVVNHKDRTIRVREAPRGGKPSWGGFLPQHLGFHLCQRMRQILSEDTVYPYLSAVAQTAIQSRRADLGALLARSGPVAAQLAEKAAYLWTFAGGQINHTLKYAIEMTSGWKVVADNIQLRIEGAGLTHATLDAALETLRTPEFWCSADNQKAILARVPDFRLSKFQQTLPQKFEAEVVGSYLLDIARTCQFLGAGRSPAIKGVRVIET